GLESLKPFRSGVVKGETKGRDFVPSADWALSIKYERGAYPEVDLDKPTALKYLHRDTLSLPEAPLGYVLVTYRGVPLGFVKNIGPRCNNLLPKGRKILMNV
ncbi:MAG TPA: rRNA cytosine-C5-methyltransferase, partial [Candidatus Cryptobacteroides merdipullorum]|nr:rRNA cytosine-C5-methyltransferase [Candidatus Cryptobacteroides merdipullorum]